MPELPEVEIVVRGLNESLCGGVKLSEVIVKTSKLRYPISKKDFSPLLGKSLIKVFRRAKYIAFEFADFYMISHLGMTGSWRWVRDLKDLRSHDHLVLNWENKASAPTQSLLVYNDPRRFGFIQVVKKQPEPKAFVELGPEPLSSDFNENYLFDKIHASSRPIKLFIMDQSLVVGVGNIYASEALFGAKINPHRKGRDVSKSEAKALIQSIRKALNESIQAGGSTLRDYRQVNGDRGGFQKLFKVYGRDTQPCPKCGTAISKGVIGQRSSYWCPRCQKNGR